MYGASYVQLERAAGPEGSSRKRVSRFAFCSVGPGTSKEGDGGKRLLCPVLTPVLVVQITSTQGKQRHLSVFHRAPHIYRNIILEIWHLSLFNVLMWGKLQSPRHFTQSWCFHLLLFFISSIERKLQQTFKVTCFMDVMICPLCFHCTLSHFAFISTVTLPPKPRVKTYLWCLNFFFFFFNSSFSDAQIENGHKNKRMEMYLFRYLSVTGMFVSPYTTRIPVHSQAPFTCWNLQLHLSLSQGQFWPVAMPHVGALQQHFQ